MLKKLLKYDSKNIYKVLVIFYILALFFAILTRILYSMEQTLIIKVLANICQASMIAMLVSAFINSIMRNWIRFKETIYGDESYLTHTLPIKKSTIYEAKFIISVTSLLITIIVSILCILIAFYTKSRWITLTETINLLTTQMNISTPLFIILISMIVFLEIFSILQSGFLGIILGYKKGNNKILKSIIIGFIIYILNQSLVLIVIYIFGLINKDIMNIFTSSIPNLQIMSSILLISFITYILITISTNLICVKELNKGVNVE